MVSQGPLISIVLPTYNGSKYISESIQSCIDQSYHNWELIVVDDKSTDNTAEIVLAYVTKDPRIKLIRHEQNKKLPGALNTGFSHSKGEYLTWTSDDNLYEPEALQLMVDYLQLHAACGMVYCDMKLIDEKGGIVGEASMKQPEQLDVGNCIGACFMYRRSIYEIVGSYADDMFLVEDYEYWLRVRRHSSMHYLDGVAPYRYRTHCGSLTAKRSTDIIIQTARAQCRHLLGKQDAMDHIDRAYWEAIWSARKAKNYKIAWKYAKLCVKNKPTKLGRWKVLLTTGIFHFLKS